MASLQHHQVQLRASEPAQPTAAPPHSPAVDRGRSLHTIPDPPPSPREGKRKKLTHEASSPNITAKQRKHSQGAKGRHSIIIEPPKMCTAWENNSHSDLAAAISETSSIHSEVSVESFVELDEKALTRIHYIVNELITTEKVYMQDLQDIVMGYMVPMEQCSDLFLPETVQDIFINIKPIGDFHLNFLEKLDEYKKELDSLADCFLTKESEVGFALYNEFCRKVPRSLDLISALGKNEDANQFIMDCKQTLNHLFPLSEFLHRPIQRILKYPLLLRDLQKYTTGTKYAAGVEAALDKITGVAIHINKVKRVQELESHEILGWPGEPLLEYGVLKLEQSFKVNGSDGRYLFLFEKLLLISKIHKDGKYQYKAHLLPSDIKMTEGDPTDPKFEIEKFKAQKKTKFVIQAPSVDIKALWVYEIKRCVLENQDNITPQMREVLLKGIPSMDKANMFNDILHNSKYKSFIYLRGFEDTEQGENGPPTPDLDTSSQNNVLSPSHKTPSPSSAFDFSSPSPDRLPHDDSGIEDPTPKNTVDYSSLDVKAIKDRWKQQEKLAGANTAPVRAFHRRMSPSIASKLETWPLQDPDMSPVQQLKKNNKVSSLGDNLKESGGREEKRNDALSPTQGSSKPCLARISHLQENKEKSSPTYRDIKSLIEADAAKSQARYDMLSPDSNTHPDCDGGTLFSALDPSSRHHAVSPKQSNGSDEVFTSAETKKNSNTIKTNLNDRKEDKKWKEQDSLELSDNDEMIVKFTKGCNISGTNTAKRNSFIIEKELHKNMPHFSPQSSDSEQDSKAAARIEKIKQRAAKLEKKNEPKEKKKVKKKDSSLTDTIMGMYDAEASRSRTPSPEDEVTENLSSLTVTDGPSRGPSPHKYSGRAVKTPRSKKEVDDKTLTRDEDTLTRDKSHIVYKGTSLIRCDLPDGKDDEKIVMRPIKTTETSSPGTMSKNRLHRRAAQRGKRFDCSDSESESSESKSSRARHRVSGLQKPSALRTNSGAPVAKSDSNSSVASSRSRADSKSSNTTKPVTGAFVQSATVKRAALRNRTPSFNQEDNPFFRESCTRTESGPAASSSKSPIGSAVRQSVGAPTKSLPTDSPRSRARGTRLCSEGLASDRRSAYLNAAKTSSSSGSKHDPPPKIESDPDMQELNSVRSSQLVARMKTQLLSNTGTK